MRCILIAVLLCAPLRAADPGEIRRAAADVTQSLDVQRQLPDDSASAAPAPSSPDRDSAPGGVEIPGGVSPAPAAVWGLLRWTLLGLAIMAVAALAVSWITEARAARVAPLAPAAAMRPAAPLTPPADPDRLLALADEYAAAGRYTDAMHHVLLAAVATLRAPDSLTSWELLRAVSLPPPSRHALQSLIGRVERAWFGKQPAGSEDYQAARGSFHAFTAAATEKA